MVASGVALLLSALIIYALKLPSSYGGFFALASYGAGCLAAGFTAGTLKRQGGLFAGIFAAFLFLLPIALIGWFAGSFTGEAALNKVIVTLLCGAVGGVIGVNRNNGF